MLHAVEPTLPDLADVERRRELMFVLGTDTPPWGFRVTGLGRPEFHLYDHDLPPVTESRQRVANVVNWRPGYCAVLTPKRSLENYLHSDAVFKASGVRVAVSDDNVADVVACALYGCREEQARGASCLPELANAAAIRSRRNG